MLKSSHISCCSWFSNSNKEKTKNWKKDETVATQMGNLGQYVPPPTELGVKDEEEYNIFLRITPENFELLRLILADIATLGQLFQKLWSEGVDFPIWFLLLERKRNTRFRKKSYEINKMQNKRFCCL